MYVSSYGAVYTPFLGAGLQYWRRFVEMAALNDVAVVGGELLPWHNLDIGQNKSDAIGNKENNPKIVADATENEEKESKR